MSDKPVVDDDPSRAASDGEVADFAVAVTEDGGQTVAHITGEIDIATCERLRDAIEPHLGPGQRVVLDLSGVSFMDSSCLKVLVQARTTLTADGGSMILRNPSDAARRVLTATGLAELFVIETGQ
jgi:anti-sigma B factor antagonist